MQAVAAEMNLSETAFLLPEGNAFHLRWFTPTIEVPICGHATLASAHVLWETGALPEDRPAVFRSNREELRAVRRGDWIELDFPAFIEHEATLPPEVARALSCTPRYVGLFPPSSYGEPNYLVELSTEAEVRALAPDFSALHAPGSPSIMATAPADSPDLDFVSRYFAPTARHRRGPGHRLLLQRPHPLLVREARQDRAHRPPGLRPHRPREGRMARPPRPHPRAGGHRRGGGPASRLARGAGREGVF